VAVLGAAVLRQLHSQHMQLAIKSRSRGFLPLKKLLDSKHGLKKWFFFVKPIVVGKVSANTKIHTKKRGEYIKVFVA
jgi:hypothetical protein